MCACSVVVLALSRLSVVLVPVQVAVPVTVVASATVVIGASTIFVV